MGVRPWEVLTVLTVAWAPGTVRVFRSSPGVNCTNTICVVPIGGVVDVPPSTLSPSPVGGPRTEVVWGTVGPCPSGMSRGGAGWGAAGPCASGENRDGVGWGAVGSCASGVSPELQEQRPCVFSSTGDSGGVGSGSPVLSFGRVLGFVVLRPSLLHPRSRPCGPLPQSEAGPESVR